MQTMKKTKKILTNILLSLVLMFMFLSNSVYALDMNRSEKLPYDIINNNEPTFTAAEKKSTTAFEKYSKLDKYGRCGVAYANICKELMPTQERESISEVHPSGWLSGMKWERCHLIGFQLAGENANDKNLITGTHYFNVEGMLPFENQIAEYVKKTNNHVLYRVTPYYSGTNLIASGVYMEAWSVEDNGRGVCFNVFCYNVTPGAEIDYKAGVVKEGKPTSINLSNKTVTYNGKVVKPFTAKVTGSKGKVIYKYYKDQTCMTPTTKKDGAFYDTGAPANAGTYYCLAIVSGDGTYSAASKTVKLVIKKAAAKCSVSGLTKTYKSDKLAKATVKYRLKTVTNGAKVSYKKTSGSSKLTVSQTGVVSIRKGTKKGTYKAKITIKVNGGKNVISKSYSKAITIKVTGKTTTKTPVGTKENYVYITKTGSKYHCVNNCGQTDPSSTTKITKEEAISRGYEACKKCY